MELFKDKHLTEEEIKKLENAERKRLGISDNKHLPMGFNAVYNFHLGTIYPDENVVKALLTLNFACTLKDIIKKFKKGDYGEIAQSDVLDNQECLFFGNTAGMFGCYKTRLGYVRIDVVKTQAMEGQSINTYISLTKEKNTDASYNLVAQEKLNNYLNNRQKNKYSEKTCK